MSFTIVRTLQKTFASNTEIKSFVRRNRFSAISEKFPVRFIIYVGLCNGLHTVNMS